MFLTGLAGSVATVLHDAVMNPAEGKNGAALVTTLSYSVSECIFVAACSFSQAFNPYVAMQ